MLTVFKKINCSYRLPLFIFTISSILLLSSCASTSSLTKETRNLLDLVDYFDNSDLKPEKIQPTRYRTLLASAGCAMFIQGAKVEFYIYDISDPKQKRKLKKIIKNNKIRVLSLDIPVAVNGGIVMLTYSDHPNKAKIIRAFKRFPAGYKR